MYNLYVQLYKIFNRMAKKVLIIDDSTDEANAIAEIFEKSGYSTVQTSDTFGALEFVYKEAPDLIILDILMPDLGGYELCRMIKADETAKNIPVVMYSKLDKNIDRFWAFRSGANAFVNKGELTSELVKVCGEAVENLPVSLEIKGKLLSTKTKVNARADISSKDALVKDFGLIKEVDADADVLALKILGTICRYFKYDCAMVSFKDANNGSTLFFDTGSLLMDEKVFDEIKQTVAIKDPIADVIMQKEEKTQSVVDLSDFFVKYEYEISAESNLIGYLYLYAINNLNSRQLKLIGTIKDLVEHLMRLRYFKVSKKDNKSSANPRKLYTQLDFDRILSYECEWHKRNSAPLCLAFVEVEAIENIESTYGNQYTDLLLAKISNFLSSCLSDGDFIYRNDENIFVILMTNSDYQGAHRKLEYLVEKIKDKSISPGEDERISVKAAALVLDEKYKNHYEYVDALYDVLELARHPKEDIVLK